MGKVLIPLLLVLLSVSTVSAQEIVLGNDKIELRFADSSADFQLNSMTNVVTGKTYASPGGTDFWKVTVRDSSGGYLTLGPENAQTYSWVLNTNGATQTLTVDWGQVEIEGLKKPVIPDTFDVSVKIHLTDGEEVAEFFVDVITTASQYSLYSVDYPRVGVTHFGTGQDEFLAIPHRGGWLVHDPLDWNTVGYIDPHPSRLNMQWLSYFNTVTKDQLFFGTRDPDGYIKTFNFQNGIGSGTFGTFFISHIPADRIVADNDFSQPYPVVYGAFEGDWVDAAEFYREWALQQPFTSRGPIAQATDVPKRLLDADLFVIVNAPENNLDYTGTAQEIQLWKDFFNSCEGIVPCNASLGVDRALVKFFFWMNNGPGLISGWPDYLPMNTGVQAYLDHAESVSGDLATAYVNPSVFATTAPQYTSEVLENGIVNEDGSMTVENLEDPTQPNVLLNHASTFAKDYNRDINVDFANLGWKGAYWDAWNAEATTLEYSGKEGHPKGGGNFYYQEMVKEIEQARTAAQAIEPEYIIYSEYPEEMFLDLHEYSQANLGFAQAPVYHAPLFDTVYGDHQFKSSVVATSVNPDPATGTFGKYLWTIYFAVGHLPAVNVNPTESTFPILSGQNFFDYLKKVFRTYVANEKYVKYGLRMRDLPLQVASTSPDQTTSQFLYASNQIPNLPNVFSPVWEAADGSLGIFLANWKVTDEPVSFSFEWDNYNLVPGEEHGLYQKNEVGLSHLGSYSGDFSQGMTIPAEAVNTYVLIRLPLFSTFGGSTTDFSTVTDITQVQNAVLEKVGFGKIEFSGTVDFSDLDLDSGVLIANNVISTDLEQLDQPATLTLEGIAFDSPVILRDGSPCSDCTLVSYTGTLGVPGDLVFTVTGFSSYSAEEGSSTCSDLGGTLCLSGEYCAGTLLPASDGVCCDQACSLAGTVVGDWRLDEGSGTTAIDVSGYGNDGVVSMGWEVLNCALGGCTLSTVPEDALHVGTNGWTASQGSVVMWARADSFAGESYLFGHSTQPAYADRIQLYVEGDGKPNIGLGDGHNLAPLLQPLNAAEWYHFALTWDSGTYTLYVDGAVVVTGSYSGLSDIHSSADIGNNGADGTEGFIGGIDEVSVHSVALSGTEVVALFAAGAPPLSCGEQSGFLCGEGETCPSTEIVSAYTGVCCDQACVIVCGDGDEDGFADSSCGGSDCDDSNPGVNPGASEVCGDGIDQDCSGGDLACPPSGGGGGGSGGGGGGSPPPSDDGDQPEEDGDGAEPTCQDGEKQPCGSNIGVCEEGARSCVNGEWGACEDEIGPGEEVCLNGLDDDCDSLVDEECELAGETCSNQQLDENEEGVDCGGVCPTACDQDQDDFRFTLSAMALGILIIIGVMVLIAYTRRSSPP